MKQRARRSSKPTAADVVDLVSESEGSDPDAATAAPQDASRRTSRGRGRAAAAAAAATIAGSTQATACDDEFEFVDSDLELELDASAQVQQKPAGGGRKRALPAARTAAGGSGKTGNGAAAVLPAAKRPRTAAGGSKASKANGSKGSRTLTNKQAAAKGFSALFLCASQHTGGSQGSADAGGGSQPAAAGGALQLTSTSAALAAAAAAGGSTAAVTAAAAAEAAGEMWVDKHVPRSVADLVVHKKKVAEVQDWLAFYTAHRAHHHTRALLVTGPPGCGKSLTVRVVAESLGFEVMEWTPPVPTLWADHQYMAGAGVRYSSKLDEFDMFVARAKFAALPLSSPTTAAHIQQQQTQQHMQQHTQQQPSQMPPPASQHTQHPQQQQQHTQQQTQQQTQQHTQQQTQQQTQQTQQQQHARPPKPRKLLLVEDLPHVADPERRGRLATALRELATTARCPVVVVATSQEGGGAKGPGGYGSYGAAGAGVTSKGLHKDLVTVLEQAGAGTISFNPITGPNLTKALAAIAEAEGYSLDADMATGIVAGAGGDLRNAIQNLQLMLQGPGAAKLKAGAKGKKGKGTKTSARPRKKASDPASVAASVAAAASVTACVGRDQGLTVFHAIGKLLHYKRNKEDGSGSSPAAAKRGKQTQQQLGMQQQQQQQEEAGDEGDGMEVDCSATQQPRRLVQPPLRLDPEAVLSGSGLEALQVAAFLSENYTRLMADDAMDEAAEAAAHLSDSAYMCCYRNSAAPSVAFWDEADPNAASLAAAAAGSVAARGLLWANRRPAPSRWLPLQGPSCFMPERAATTNMGRLGGALQALQDEGRGRSQVLGLAGQLLHAGRQDRAAQVLPYLQVLARSPSRLWLHALLPRSWAYIWQGSITERPSPALQGAGSAAVAAALEVAVAAAAAAAAGAAAGRGSQQAAGVGEEVGAGGEGGGEEEEEESEEIESDSD